MQNRIYIRKSNWEIRKNKLREKNIFDIKYDPEENFWIINETYTGKNCEELRKKINKPPYIILHDDAYIFFKFLEHIFRGKELEKKKEIFVSLYSRFNIRYKPFLLESEGIPIIFIETGIGSASTYRIMEVLSALNIKFVLKMGTISGLQSFLKRGDIVFPKYAYNDEGASKFDENYDTDFKKTPKYTYYANYQDELYDLLHSTTQFNLYGPDKNFSIWSVDAYENFDICTDLYTDIQKDIIGVEMECSAFFSSSQRHKIPAAAVLVVVRTLKDLLDKFDTKSKILNNNKIIDIQIELLKTIIEMIGGGKLDVG